MLQPEPVREMQLVPAAVEPNPPHATSPSWVWYILPAGRGGTEQEWGTPEGVSTSTDDSTDPYPLPPVTIMALVDEDEEMPGKHV